MSGGGTPPLPQAFLSLVPASRQERQLGLAVVLASVICFFAVLPFGGRPAARVDAFVPIYEAALCVADLITTALLFGQFARLRSRALLMLAAGYLFAAQIVVVHALTFPGVFSPTGLLGAGPQTSPWIYVVWHVIFPLFVLAYALLRGTRHEMLHGPPWRAACGTVAGVTVLVAGFSALTTAGHAWLPVALAGDVFLWPPFPGGLRPGVLAGPMAVLLVLSWRGRPTTLDLWLMVVMAAWILDVLMSATVSRQRYDLAFYVGRSYGLMAACFVLIVLLTRLNRLYDELARTLGEAKARNAELARSREEFARVQRFEALGQVVGGLAHDFNNLLTVMTGSLDLIQRDPGNAMGVARMSWTALEAARRGERLTRQLLSFARRQVLHPEVVDLNRLIAGLETFLQRAAGEHTHLACLHAPDLWPVYVDVGEFEATLLNLVLNARDAIAAGANGGGRISILTRNAVLDAAEAAGNPDAAAGEYVAVAVRDTGCGMPPEVLARVFEPFFTTKDAGHGSGLGLSQVYGFASAAGGHVTIASMPGNGTTVTLFLARSRGQPRLEEAAVPMPYPAGGRGAILLVEDDPAVRDITVEGLETLGYTVTVARDAAEALAALRADRPIDVMFADVVLPGGMNGAQLAMHARVQRPDMHVLLTSGYCPSALVGAHGVPPGTEVLSKPYRRDQLARILNRLLDR